MHILDFDIPHSLRLTSFRIVDTSSYDPTLPVEEGLIEIFAPSSIEPFIWRVERGYTLVVNANLLHLNPMGSLPLPSLPDGSYYIKYSVKPNNKVQVQYLHFRNTKQLNSYYNLCVLIHSKKCEVPNKEHVNRIKELHWIKQLIDAAKYIAEEKHLLHEANLMYQEAASLISKMTTCNAK